MTERTVNEIRLLQIFLSPGMTPGPTIHEVSLDANKNLLCTCSAFSKRSTCKHAMLVNNRVRQNNGTYPLEISSKATQEEADKAKESPEAFRMFIIKYGKIEVC